MRSFIHYIILMGADFVEVTLAPELEDSAISPSKACSKLWQRSLFDRRARAANPTMIKRSVVGVQAFLTSATLFAIVVPNRNIEAIYT